MGTRQISAAILAGGHSSRMGTDKALLRLHPDGPTLIEKVAAQLTEAGLPPGLLVTDTPGRYDWLGIKGVTDEIPGTGALGGILTALVHSPTPRTLVVACDMPLLNPGLLRYMASLPQEADAIVPRWVSEDGQIRIEPLHAIYAASCIEPMRQRLDLGKLKVTDALSDLSVTYIEEAELRRFDRNLDSFRNVNRPEEWVDLAQASKSRPEVGT